MKTVCLCPICRAVIRRKIERVFLVEKHGSVNSRFAITAGSGGCPSGPIARILADLVELGVLIKSMPDGHDGITVYLPSRLMVRPGTLAGSMAAPLGGEEVRTMSRLHVSGPSLFQPGGLSYFKVPHKYRKVIKGEAMEVLAALDAFCMKQTVLVISDAVIARFLNRSLRFVQRGLRKLEKHLLIFRFTEWCEGVKCRTIYILEALLESDEQRRNRERREKLASKNSGTGHVKTGRESGCKLRPLLLLFGRRNNVKNNKTTGGGESDGTDPPPGLGGEEHRPRLCPRTFRPRQSWPR